MEIEVKSKEYIKPSSYDEKLIREYKLSLPDQLALHIWTPFVFFYDSRADSRAHQQHRVVDELKKSLSRTLDVFYPLAGRLREDNITIECNGEGGVEFIVTDVAQNIGSFLDDPKIEILRLLTPCIPNAGEYKPSPVGEALLAIQVNRFSCGGMAIGLIVSHAFGTSTIATVLNTWATIHRGGTVAGGDGSVFDCSRIFPPLANTSTLERLTKYVKNKEDEEEKYSSRRFFFSSLAIARLKERFGVENYKKKEVLLFALVWAAVLRASVPQHITAHELSCGIHLRDRVVPPLPPNCLANAVISHGVNLELTGNSNGNSLPDYNSLVNRIHDSLQMVDHDFVRNKYGEGGALHALFSSEVGVDLLLSRMFRTDSYTLHAHNLCGVPYYDSDFGWGKPRWVVLCSLLRNSLLLIDAINGGVEAWLALPKEVMNILLQDQEFLAYVSTSLP